MECLPLWPMSVGEKGRTLGKTYGIKVRYYWEHVGNKWKLKNSLSLTHPKLKRRKIKALLSALLSLAREHPAEQLKPHQNKLPFQLLFAWKSSSLLWILPFAPKRKKKLSSWVMLSSAGTMQHFVPLLWVSVLMSSCLLCFSSSKGLETC